MRRWLFAFPFATILALLIAIPTSPEPAQATHTWGNFHWARQSNPFTLRLGDNLSSTWDSYRRLVPVGCRYHHDCAWRRRSMSLAGRRDGPGL